MPGKKYLSCPGYSSILQRLAFWKCWLRPKIIHIYNLSTILPKHYPNTRCRSHRPSRGSRFVLDGSEDSRNGSSLEEDLSNVGKSMSNNIRRLGKFASLSVDFHDLELLRWWCWWLPQTSVRIFDDTEDGTFMLKILQTGQSALQSKHHATKMCEIGAKLRLWEPL